MTDAGPGIYFTLCAAIVLLSLAFASFARDWPNRRVSAFAIAAAILATSLLLVGTLWLSTDRLGDVRLRLRSVTFTFSDERRTPAVSFGGHRDRDEIVIAGRTANEPRMSAEALTVRRSQGDPGALELRFNGAGTDRWTGLIWHRDDRSGVLGRLLQRLWPSESEPLGGIDFDSTTALCLPNAGGVDVVRLSADGERLTLNGRDAFYSLRPLKGAPALIQDYAAVARAGAEPNIPRSRSLLLRSGGKWQIVILDTGAHVVRGDCGGGAPRLAPAALLMRPGDSRHFSFQPLSPSERWQVAAAIAAGADAAPMSRLIERRSGTLRVVASDAGEPLLTFTFDSPESLRIAASDIDDGSTRDLTLSLSGQEDRAWSLDLAATRFRATGMPLASGFVQRLQLNSSTAALIGNRSIIPVREAQPFDLGVVDRARVVLERLDLGWSPVAGAPWLALAGLIAGLAATWGWRRRSAYAFIVLSLAEFLLTIRLLVAIEAAIIDPSGPGTMNSVPASVLALAIVPIVLAALAPTAEKAAVRPGWVVLHTLLAAAIAAHVYLFNGLRVELLALFCPAFLSASYVRLRPAAGTGWARAARNLAGRAAAAIRKIADLMATIGARLRFRAAAGAGAADGPPKIDPFAEALLTMLAASLILSIRLLLPEQLLSFRTAIIYTPLWLTYCAFAFRAAARAIAAVTPAGWALWLLWLLLLPLPLVWAVRDPGFVMVNLAVLVVLILLLTLWFGPKAGAKRLLPGGPAVAAAAAVAAAMLLSSTSIVGSSWPDPMDSSAAAEQKRLDFIEKSVRASRVERRIQAWFTPARLAESGTRQAEELTVALNQMRQYGSQGYFGRGYLNQPEPTELRLYQLNDNVSAVHLLAPFGRMGTAAFLLVLGCAAAGATWRRIDRTERAAPTYRECAAYVALWTLFVGSAYMVLANLQLVPFTGRNVFLLAASSTSDLVEGVTLLAVALAGLRSRESAR